MLAASMAAQFVVARAHVSRRRGSLVERRLVGTQVWRSPSVLLARPGWNRGERGPGCLALCWVLRDRASGTPSGPSSRRTTHLPGPSAPVGEHATTHWMDTARTLRTS